MLVRTLFLAVFLIGSWSTQAGCDLWLSSTEYKDDNQTIGLGPKPFRSLPLAESPDFKRWAGPDLLREYWAVEELLKAQNSPRSYFSRALVFKRMAQDGYQPLPGWRSHSVRRAMLSARSALMRRRYRNEMVFGVSEAQREEFFEMPNWFGQIFFREGDVHEMVLRYRRIISKVVKQKIPVGRPLTQEQLRRLPLDPALALELSKFLTSGLRIELHAGWPRSISISRPPFVEPLMSGGYEAENGRIILNLAHQRLLEGDFWKKLLLSLNKALTYARLHLAALRTSVFSRELLNRPIQTPTAAAEESPFIILRELMNSLVKLPKAAAVVEVQATFETLLGRSLSEEESALLQNLMKLEMEPDSIQQLSDLSWRFFNSLTRDLSPSRLDRFYRYCAFLGQAMDHLNTHFVNEGQADAIHREFLGEAGPQLEVFLASIYANPSPYFHHPEYLRPQNLSPPQNAP